MTLYTGRDNPAIYIFERGFKVVKSFSTMKKIYNYSSAY
jgi:hypothetical protein